MEGIHGARELALDSGKNKIQTPTPRLMRGKGVKMIIKKKIDDRLECSSCGAVGTTWLTDETVDRGEYETCLRRVCLACGHTYLFSATCGEWGQSYIDLRDVIKLGGDEMNVYLTKTPAGFVPFDAESKAWAQKIRSGEVVTAEFKKARNYKFLKKYFALLTIGFENWEPGTIDSRYDAPEKNFDQYREDVIILAGYYYATIRLDGTVRVRAKSISFAYMDEEEFSKLYNATIDVLLKHVYKRTITEAELENIVSAYMSFA